MDSLLPSYWSFKNAFIWTKYVINIDIYQIDVCGHERRYETCEFILPRNSYFKVATYTCNVMHVDTLCSIYKLYSHILFYCKYIGLTLLNQLKKWFARVPQTFHIIRNLNYLFRMRICYCQTNCPQNFYD